MIESIFKLHQHDVYDSNVYSAKHPPREIRTMSLQVIISSGILMIRF